MRGHIGSLTLRRIGDNRANMNIHAQTQAFRRRVVRAQSCSGSGAWLGVLGRLPLLVALAVVPGCKRSGDGLAASAESSPVMLKPASGGDLTRTDLLLQVLATPHAEVAARLGPHRIESQTTWVITPVVSPGAVVPPPVVPGFKLGSPERPFDGGEAYESVASNLQEQKAIAIDSEGRVLMQSQTDHGAGVDAVFAGGLLYVRMKHTPYIRYRPEGDQVARLRTAAYEPGTAILEAVAPYLQLSTPTEATVQGRAAWQVKLSRLDSPSGVRPKGLQGPQSVWRTATSVDTIEGMVIVDRQKGAPLQVELRVRFVAPRTEGSSERVQVEAQHSLKVVQLGAAVAPILPPTEWSEPPTRPRPMLDRQELLNGLVPARP